MTTVHSNTNGHVNGHAEHRLPQLLAANGDIIVDVHGIQLSASHVKRSMETILAIREFVLKSLVPDVDIIQIPGVDRPVLGQPGADKIALLLGGYYRHRLTEREIGNNGHLEVVVTAELVSHASGKVIGEGVGSCSTMESKYRYRDDKRKCPACGSKEALNRSKREPAEWFCWAKKGGCGETFAIDHPAIAGQVVGKVENPDPADVRNTVRKMAVKRAEVDCSKRAGCVSGDVTQDLEDFDLDRVAAATPTPRQTPAAKPQSADAPDRRRDAAPTASSPEALPPGRELWNKIQAVVKRVGQRALHAVSDFGQAQQPPYPTRIIDWDAAQAQAGEEVLLRIDAELSKPATPKTQPSQPTPDADRSQGSVGARFRAEVAHKAQEIGHPGLLAELHRWGQGMQFSSRMADWTADQVSAGKARLKDMVLDLKREGGA